MADASTAAQKWSRNLAAAGPSIQTGVQQTSKDPTALAIAQKEVAAANYQAALASGKWAAGLQRSGKAGWQAGMISKGIPRIAQGAQAGMPKMQAALAQIIPAVNAAVASLPPRGGLEQNLARAAAFARAMAQFKRS